MGLFGTNLDKLVERRDIPGLWKVYVKKKHRVGGDELLRFANQAWDYIYELYLTKDAKQNDVAEFALFLEKQKKPYAGSLPVTPAEFAARMSVTASLKKDSKGKCPKCGDFLSTGGSGSAVGHYRICRDCGQYYHEGCALSLDRCKRCDGWQWRSVRRVRVKSS
jgi:hypothetical protein